MGILQETHAVEGSDDLNFVTPRGRMSFVALDKKFKNKDAKEGDDGSYSVSVVLDAGVDIKKLQIAATTLAKAKFGAAAKDVDFLKGKHVGFKTPFLKAADTIKPEDMGEEDLDGRVLLRANTYRDRPGVRDKAGLLVSPDDLIIEAYPGRFARLEVRLHAYDSNNNRGVKLYLTGVQLLGPGEKMKNRGGVSTTAENFGAVEDEEEDALA